MTQYTNEEIEEVLTPALDALIRQNPTESIVRYQALEKYLRETEEPNLSSIREGLKNETPLFSLALGIDLGVIIAAREQALTESKAIDEAGTVPVCLECAKALSHLIKAGERTTRAFYNNSPDLELQVATLQDALVELNNCKVGK